MALVVGLMYNLGKHAPPADGEPPDANAEFDSEETVLAIASALAAGGYDVVRIEGNEQAYDRLREVRPDIVFNITEGLRGESRESHIPCMLEMLGIPYTGSGPLALAVSLDKPAAKKIFAYHGVPTPQFRSIAPGEPADVSGLRFPLFVKPAREGSSKGIESNAVCHTPAELAERVAFIHDVYRQPALVEEFLSGREFTVGIIGNAEPHLLPIMELNYAAVPTEHGAVYSRRFKAEWDADQYYLCPAPVSDELAEQIRHTALDAYRALGCVDVGRVDLRLDAAGVPHVLEINPLPGLTPGYSDLCRVAAADGLSYLDLIHRIVNSALDRYGLTRKPGPRLAQSA